MHLVDIDQSDSEDGGKSCCSIYWFSFKKKNSQEHTVWFYELLRLDYWYLI